MTPSYWTNRKVAVTGHTGFKGGWLVLLLEQFGAKVMGFALDPPTTPSLYELANVGRAIDSVIGDIRDYAALKLAIDRFEPEIVFHLAAQPIVRLSYDQPIDTYGTNVLGTVHVLEAARSTPSVRVIVNVTSDKCYENREWLWGYRENEPMGGYDPYSSSKGCAELVTSTYIRCYCQSPEHPERGPALASARAGNVIGGGDWATDRLVPDIVRSFLAGREVLIRAPKAVRPWQHVLEPLSGYLQLAERLAGNGARYAGGWNFGPPSEAVADVATIAERIRAIWGEPRRWVDASDPRAVHEARLLQLDSTKARMELGWSPRWSLDEALEATVRWYQLARDETSARNITRRQIEAYLSAPPRK